MNKTGTYLTRLFLIGIIATTTWPCPSFCANDELRPSENRLRNYSSGDEAFTEPIETIKIASAETGIIAAVNVKRGDVVDADDLLFELDMSVLKATLRLAQAKANTIARLKAAEAQLESKTKLYEKLAELLRDNAGNPKEVDRAKTDVEVARQDVAAIIEENEQYRLETKRIESQMEQRRIRAPIHGVIVDVLKKPGEYVSSNEAHLATIVQLETLRVVFYLPTARAAKINQGDSADILLTETDQHAVGIVEYVAPITHAESGRVRVEVLIRNELAEYRSGVRCRILETVPRQSMILEPFENR